MDLQHCFPQKKVFDLQERTILFAQRIRAFVKKLPRTKGNNIDGEQLLRSTSSVAANYAEADEAISKKDFFHRCRICRKEAKESRIHLCLLDVGGNTALEQERGELMQEAKEFVLIFSSIIRKNES